MALSTRDVMFALRAQDFASRRVNAVGSAFNRLGKQIEASKIRAEEAAKSFQKAADQRIQPLKDANTQITRQNEIMKKQVAGIKENTRVTRSNMNASKARLDAENDLLKRQSQGHKSVIDQARSSNQAIRDGMKLDKERTAARLDGMNQANKVTGKQIQQQRAQISQITRQSQSIVDGYKQQNHQIREGIAARRNLYGATSQQYQAHKAAAQSAIDYNKRQIEQERLLTREALRARNSTLAGLQATQQAREREITQLQRSAAQSKSAAESMILDNKKLIRDRQKLVGENDRLINSNTRQSAEEARAAQARIRHNEATIAGLNRRIKRNEGVIASNNRLAQTHQKAAESQIASIRRVEAAEQARLAGIQRASQRMMMGGAAMTIGGMITAAIGGTIISKLNQATKAAAEFRHGIALAHTQIDETGKAAGATIGQLGQLVMRVGRQVPAAMEEMPQTLFFIFTALNASVSEAESLLKGFAQEAVAGNASVEASARSTIAILNGMNYSVDELTRVQDFQFQTVRKGVITYEQLSANIGKVIPPLRRMGQEVEIGGAMLAFLTRQGLSAEMAATSAARSLELFSDPRVINRLEGMGVSMRDDVTGEFEHFGVIINDLASQFDGLTGPERAEQMREIFGGAGFRIQARRFLDTVFASEESLAHFNQQIEWAENNTGAFARAFENMSQEPAVRLQELSNQFFTLRHELGIGMLPILEKVVEKFSQLADWFANIDEGTRTNIAQWAAYGAATLLVVGGLTALAGILVTIAGMLTMLIPSVKLAVGITLGFIPVVTALGIAFGLLMMNGFDLGAILESLGLTFDTNAGQAKILTIALGAITTALLLSKAAGMGYFAMLGVVTGAIKAKITAAIALSKALWLIIATNPIIAMFAALTLLAAGLAIAFSRTTREARELQAATDRQTDAHNDQIDTISSSIEGFENYRNHMKEAAKTAAEQTLAERDLESALERSKTTRYEYLEGVAGTPEQHERVRQSLEKEVDQLKENSSWWARNNAGAIIEIGTNSKRISQSEELLEAFNLEYEARETAEQAMQREMRARGGMSQMIAQYLSMSEREGPLAEHNTAKMRERIIATLDAQGVLDGMNEEQREALFNSEDLAEAVEKLTTSYADLGAELTSVLSDIRNPATALSEALESINEAGQAAAEGTDEAFEAFESLIEASGGAEQAASNWLDVLREQEQETTDLFGNMSAVYDHHEDSIVRNADGSIEAILALGEAGPEAMEILASASPEQFIEIMHHIRTQAAMTSEDVQDNIGLMFAQMKGMQDDYQNVSEQQWTDIMMGMSLIISSHGEDAVEHMPRLMAMMAEHIENGGEINATEIANMMDDFFLMIENGSGKILEFWPGVHDALGKILRDKGIENADVFDSVMDDLETIASLGGENAVEALREKLAAGTGGVARVARAYADILAGNLNGILDTLGEKTIVLQGYDAGQFHNKGGFVPGSGPDRDSVIAGLTPGEFVLRRKAVEKMDPHVLDHLNRTGDISAVAGMYNAGGWVRPEDLPKPPGAGAYSPRINPLIDPAQATTKKMYDVSKSWVAEQVPPLSTGIGYQAMMQAIRAVFPGTALHSGLRPGAITATGNPSYHGQGRAVDIPPDMRLFNWIRDNYAPQTRELIFSPAGMRQVHNGGSHMYTGVTRSMHYDHIHWAMANGGTVMKNGRFMVGEDGPEILNLNRGDTVRPLSNSDNTLGDTNSLEHKLDKLLELLAEREPLQVNVETKDDPEDFARRSAIALKARM